VGAARLLLRQAVLELEVSAAATDANVDASSSASVQSALIRNSSSHRSLEPRAQFSSSHRASSSTALVATALEALAQECTDYYQHACYAEHAELLLRARNTKMEGSASTKIKKANKKGKAEDECSDINGSENENIDANVNVNDNNSDDADVAAAAGAALVVAGRLSPRLERIGRR